MAMLPWQCCRGNAVVAMLSCLAHPHGSPRSPPLSSLSSDAREAASEREGVQSLVAHDVKPRVAQRHRALAVCQRSATAEFGFRSLSFYRHLSPDVPPASSSFSAMFLMRSNSPMSRTPSPLGLRVSTPALALPLTERRSGDDGASRNTTCSSVGAALLASNAP
jgi:hypothetical protein